VLTIHNLLHQGRAPMDVLRYLGIQASRLFEEGPGEISLLAQAIFRATMISTVSPAYSREILTPHGGAALDALLRYRHFDVHGILNGIDYDVYDPASDPHLAATFDVQTLDRRRENKRALQARVGLPQRDDVPLLAMVSRLDGQKGFDILGHALHLLLNGNAGDAQVVVLGTGAQNYEAMLRHLAEYHRDKMTAVLGYNGQLAPLVYGGSDMFLMPSLFEPCGLGQMIAMRYGSVPVVRATGGLADTVFDGVSGFTFHDYSVDDLWDAMRRAIYIYWNDRDSWRAMQQTGMQRDFSWTTSARGYQQLYEWAIARLRGW